jgi:hypothetical protein
MDLNNEHLNFFDNAVNLKINKIPREEDLEIINLYLKQMIIQVVMIL